MTSKQSIKRSISYEGKEIQTIQIESRKESGTNGKSLQNDKLVIYRISRNSINNLVMWRLWARALGEKVGEDNKRADKVAFIRTLLILQAVITNLLIVLNIIKNW